MGHRLSNKERPLSPELMSPGLESVRADEGEKEVVPQQYRPQPLPAGWQGQHGAQEERQDRTFCGMSKKALFILLAVIIVVILGIALGVGLGVGLGKNENSYVADGSSYCFQMLTRAGRRSQHPQIPHHQGILR